MLNGALKVASAVCSTVSVDIQRAMKSSALLPKVSQKRCEELNWDSFGADSFTYLNKLTNSNNDSGRNLQEALPVTFANPPGANIETKEGITDTQIMQTTSSFFNGLGIRKFHSDARCRYCRPGTVAGPRMFHTAAVRMLDTSTPHTVPPPTASDAPPSNPLPGSNITDQKVVSCSRSRCIVLSVPMHVFCT